MILVTNPRTGERFTFSSTEALMAWYGHRKPTSDTLRVVEVGLVSCEGGVSPASRSIAPGDAPPSERSGPETGTLPSVRELPPAVAPAAPLSGGAR